MVIARRRLILRLMGTRSRRRRPVPYWRAVLALVFPTLLALPPPPDTATETARGAPVPRQCRPQTL